jgi:hypothetical protein
MMITIVSMLIFNESNPIYQLLPYSSTRVSIAFRYDESAVWRFPFLSHL